MRKKQAKKIGLKDDHKYEIPLDNSLMQRIRASEIILEKESKGTTSDPSQSPMTNKTVNESPVKSVQKISSKSIDKHVVNKENADANKDADNSNKRESLFDLRKRNKKPLEDEKGKESVTSPQHSADKVMIPEDEPKREIIKEIVEEKDEEIMEPEHFEYTLYPLGINEKDAVSFLEKYLLKLEDGLAKSYANPKDLFSKSMTGNNTQWYGLRNKGSTKDIDGLFIYNLDSHFNRLNILHLTTINKKGLEEAIEKVMKHIWAKETMQEVRLGLYHYDYDKDGKTAKTVDVELRDALKKKKMRWKNILNEDNDRILVMGALREKGEEKHNELDEIFTVKSCLLFNTTDKYPGYENPSEEKSMYFPSSLFLNSL